MASEQNVTRLRAEPKLSGGNSLRRSVAMLLKVAAALFVVEFAVMCILPLLGFSRDNLSRNVADSLMLAILALPVLYVLGFSSRRLIETDPQQCSRLERRMLTLLVVQLTMVLVVIAVYGLLATGQESGSRVINVVGRQRMLSRRLVEAAMMEAMELAHAELAGREPKTSAAIGEASAQFERAHRGLIEGDAELELPPCASDETARQLRSVGAAWETLRALTLRTSEPSDMDEAFAYYAALDHAGNQVVKEVDKAVSILESHYEGRARLLSSLLGMSIAAAAVISLLLAVALRQAMRHRKRLDSTVAESEAKTRAIVDNAADGIITINERGIIHSFNAAAVLIFGYAADEVIGKNVNVLMPSPHQEEHDGYLQGYLANGEKKVIGIRRELVGRRKDDSTFPMDLHVSEVCLVLQR